MVATTRRGGTFPVPEGAEGRALALGLDFTEGDQRVFDDAVRWQTDFVCEAEKGHQPGDPDKLAELLVEVAYAEEPPLHLPVGEDAPAVLDALREKLAADTDGWRDRVVVTSF